MPNGFCQQLTLKQATISLWRPMIVPRTVCISASVLNSGSLPPQITGSHSLGGINQG